MNKDNINNSNEADNEAVNAGENEETENTAEVSEEAVSDDTELYEEDDFADAPTDDDDKDETDIDLPLDIDREAEEIPDEDIAPISRRDVRKSRNPLSRVNIVKTKAFKVCVIILAFILAAALALYAVCINTLPKNTILRNVMIEDIDVSGLTFSEALKKIDSTELLEEQKITLSCNGHSYSINGDEVSLSASLKDTAKIAYSYGKSGNKFRDGFTAFTLLFHKHVIIPSASFDEAKMREKITEFGNQVFGERKNHYVEIGDGKAIVWPGQTGFNGDIDAAFEKISEAVAKGNHEGISVSFASAPPDDLTLEMFDNEVYTDPVDAHFEIVENEVKVIEEANGRYINKEEAAALLPNVKEGGNPIEIPFYYSYPTVFAADLNGKLFANTMASYSTSYASSGANRSSNVARAASLINGKILMPGEVFSFNDTVGRRTVENGFKTAPEYVNGKTVDGIGGGTCQVSSTLYNAVLYSDLEIVTRTNHMFAVGYAPNGQDATVADTGVDFKFRNNTQYPIKISAYTGGGSITVSIIGTNYDPKHEVKISNSSSYLNNGDIHVTSTRTVYANGQVIKTESIPSSHYKKHVEESESETSAQTSSETVQEVSAPVTQTAPSDEDDEDDTDYDVSEGTETDDEDE